MADRVVAEDVAEAEEPEEVANSRREQIVKSIGRERRIVKASETRPGNPSRRPRVLFVSCSDGGLRALEVALLSAETVAGVAASAERTATEAEQSEIRHRAVPAVLQHVAEDEGQDMWRDEDDASESVEIVDLKAEQARGGRVAKVGAVGLLERFRGERFSAIVSLDDAADEAVRAANDIAGPRAAVESDRAVADFVRNDLDDLLVMLVGS